MEIQLQYGKGTINIQIPDSVEVAVLEPVRMSPVDLVDLSLKTVLEQAAVKQPVILPADNKKQTIAIAVPDDSQALPVAEILPTP